MAQPFRAAALALSTVLAGICVPIAQAQCVGPGDRSLRRLAAEVSGRS
jgi:hypothetical protein